MSEQNYRSCQKCSKKSHIKAGPACPHCGSPIALSQGQPAASPSTQNSENKQQARIKSRKKEMQDRFNHIAKETGDDQFFTKKELHYLPEVLRDGEEVLAFSSGLMEGNTWLIALTNKRVIFLDKGMIYGLKQAFIDLHRVNAISGSTGILLGTLTITDGATSRTVKNVPKQTVKPFTNKAHDAIEALRTPKPTPDATARAESPADLLSKLANLRDQGILTDAEFALKKQEILGRI